jgi:Ca-activated chloride channel family protein
MLDRLGDLHFLRPLWLAGLAAALGLYVVIRFRTSADRQWRGVIAPHLLKHVKVSGGRASWFRPIHLIVLILVLGSLGLAGPTWQREQSPFTEDLSPLVIALDLSQSMDAIDVAPTRLERAKQKVRDLLQLRQGGRTGLLVYSGSAHPVLPFTDDPSLIEIYVTALRTDIMPVPGKNPSAALAAAEEMLERDTVPGTILFLTDGIATENVPAFVQHRDSTRDQVMVLAFGTSEGAPISVGENRFLTDRSGRRVIARLDRAGLETLRARADVDVTSATVDDDDINRIQRRVQSHLQAVRAEDENTRWKDFGYFMVLPVALLGLLWFRKGWTVQWAPALLLLALTGCSSGPGEFRFADLWLTANQQGRYFFEREDYATAAERFEDPMWKGLAFYRAGDYDSAINWLARIQFPEGYYNLGNAFAQIGSYEQAIESYELALEARPDWIEAEENRALVASLIPPPEEERPGDAPPPGDPTFDPDEVRFDERGEQGQQGEVEMSMLTDEQIAEMWLRRLQTSPADFLRIKFALQEESSRARR